ncbi:MAG: ABC transporter permease [Opitutaceae bacterium]|jgi:ABC-2 type transport system permease protein
MNRIPALLAKELRVLLRDRGGLLVTFLMPLAVLLIVTLVQDGAFKKLSRVSTSIVIVDEDNSALSRSLAADLASVEGITLHSSAKGAAFDRKVAREALSSGSCQALVILPKGLQVEASKAARRWADHAFLAPEFRRAAPLNTSLRIECSFDSSVAAPHRSLILLSLERIAQGREFEMLMKEWSRALPQHMGGKAVESSPSEAEFTEPEYSPGLVIAVSRPSSANDGTASQESTLLPDMLRFNVPAYSVFAMFFIVIPVSTCLLRERHDGTLTRLLTMPVAPAALIAAKLLLFQCVALLQFGLMLVAGKWILPALGTGAFDFSASPLLLLGLTLCTGFAAVGVALAIAASASSHEQASMTGATVVVILAALGGVMVPVAYMPPVMRLISGFTPLNWAVTAYQDAFIRGAGFASLAPRMALLCALGFIGTASAWSRLFKRA